MEELQCGGEGFIDRGEKIVHANSLLGLGIERDIAFCLEFFYRYSVLPTWDGQRLIDANL
jgi:hypothetical protein